MDHIEFDFYDDFTTPLIQFLDRIGFDFGFEGVNRKKLFFPAKLFELPSGLKL